VAVERNFEELRTKAGRQIGTDINHFARMTGESHGAIVETYRSLGGAQKGCQIRVARDRGLSVERIESRGVAILTFQIRTCINCGSKFSVWDLVSGAPELILNRRSRHRPPNVPPFSCGRISKQSRCR
jgi:hypothetical protein